MRRLSSSILWAVGLTALASPFFFVLYRLELFNTLPRDDYAPYLLWLAGDPLGGIPDSPYVYRLFSVALAWPFYVLLPPIPLTNIPAALSQPVVHATAALAALSYIATLGTALLAAWLARVEAGLDQGHVILAGALAWALCWHAQITAIDSVALMAITAALCLIRRPAALTVLLVVSIGVNEKIALTLAIWLCLRCLASRSDRSLLWRQALTSVVCVALYAVMVALLHRGGNSYQLQPSSFPITITENLHAYASSRGLLLNILPTLILAAIALLGRPHGLFARVDILVIPAMLVVALVLTHLFQAGRLVMHAAPLFVVPAAAAIYRLRDTSRPARADVAPSP